MSSKCRWNGQPGSCNGDSCRFSHSSSRGATVGTSSTGLEDSLRGLSLGEGKTQCHWQAVFGYCKQSKCPDAHADPKNVAELTELPTVDLDEKQLGSYKPQPLLYFSLKDRSSSSPLTWAGLTRKHFKARFRLIDVKDLPAAKIPTCPFVIATTFQKGVDWVPNDYQSAWHTRLAFEQAMKGASAADKPELCIVTERNNLNKIIGESDWNVGIQKIGNVLFFNKHKSYGNPKDRPLQVFVGGSGLKFEARCKSSAASSSDKYYTLVRGAIGNHQVFISGETDSAVDGVPTEIKTIEDGAWDFRGKTDDGIDFGTKTYFQSMLVGVTQVLVGDQTDLGKARKQVKSAKIINLKEIEDKSGSKADRQKRFTFLTLVLDFAVEHVKAGPVYRLQWKDSKLTLWQLDDRFRFFDD